MGEQLLSSVFVSDDCKIKVTQIKNYFYGWIEEESPFVISQQIRDKATKKKITLVLDMD